MAVEYSGIDRGPGLGVQIENSAADGLVVLGRNQNAAVGKNERVRVITKRHVCVAQAASRYC